MKAVDLRTQIVLDDPGLVLNSQEAEHCVHACFQMIFRTKTGGHVPSFDELDQIMQKEPGKYTWEHGLIGQMPSHGFDTRVIWQFDLARLATEPAAYLMFHYGDEIGQVNIVNSNLEIVSAGAYELLHSSATIEQRTPNFDDVVALLSSGFYLVVTINQRVLQADPGYVSHNILVYGASARGVRIHNPGPPATAASEITWDLFDRAWSYPTLSARNIMAFKPCRGI